jgi:uncharacterized alpha-E superfamily protein
MPGGIARSARDPGSQLVANQSGGILKDIWVIASSPQRYTSLWQQSDSIRQVLRRQAALPSRTAENLFWVGRYAERAEMLARMLRTLLRQVQDNERNEEDGVDNCLDCLVTTVRKMTDVTDLAKPAGSADNPETANDPLATIFEVMTDDKSAGSFITGLEFMFNAAQAVRERWSSDSWHIINDLETYRLNLKHTPNEPRAMHQSLDQLIFSLLAFSGLCKESMSRELGWTMLDIGRRLERALMLGEFIRRSLAVHRGPQTDALMMESVLRTTENIITYRRRYRSYLARNAVLDLLLMDDKNPRSLIFQLDQIQAHIADLPKERGGYRIREEERLALEATTRLRLSDIGKTCEMDEACDDHGQLDILLKDIRRLLENASQVLSHTYFIHTPRSRRLEGSTVEQEA